MIIYHPQTIQEAVAARVQNESAVYLAGGTENLRLGSPNEGKDLIDINGLLSDSIDEKDGMLEIGALCTLQTLKEDSRVPAILREAAGFCASFEKRNSATVGGNLGARRQDSYLAAALAAAGAVLKVLTPDGEKTKPVTDYLTCTCKCLIVSISVNADAEGWVRRFGNTVSSRAAVIAARGSKIRAVSASGSPFLFGESDDFADGAEFTDDITGSAEYKKYLTKTVFAAGSGKMQD